MRHRPRAACGTCQSATRGEVVHPHRRTERPGDPAGEQAVLRQDREQEREDLDEVGSVLAESLALTQRLVDEAHVAVLQIAKTAVHQLGALRGGPRREVLGFDQRRGKAARCGIEGDADAGDAPADDQDVEVLRCETAQHGLPIERPLDLVVVGGGGRGGAVSGSAHDGMIRRAETPVPNAVKLPLDLAPWGVLSSRSQTRGSGDIHTCRCNRLNGASWEPAEGLTQASSIPTMTTRPSRQRRSATDAASGSLASSMRS